MHTKKIKGNTYYYTTFRKGNEHRTVYLGSDEGVARQKEEAVKAGEAYYEPSENPRSSRRFWLFFIVLLLCGLTFFFVKYEVTGSYFGAPYVGWVTGDVARDVADFTVPDDLIKVAMKQREDFKRVIRISNTGSKYLAMTVNSNLGNLVRIPESKFTLPIGYTKDVELFFSAPQNIEPGVYAGKIMFNSESLQDSSFTVVEVESVNVLYDLTVSIPNQFRNIVRGHDLVFNVRLFNFDKVPNDVTLYYMVKDFNGDTIYEISETVHLESEVSFTKTITLPNSIKEGNYVLAARVAGKESVGTSTALFDVVGNNEESPAAFAFDINDYMMIFILVLITLVFVVVVTTLLEYRRLRHIEFRDELRVSRYRPQEPVVIRKQSPMAILMSAIAKKMLAPKPKIKEKIIVKPPVIIKQKPKIIVKERGRSGISMFFKALARKIKERPKIKKEIVVKPQVIIREKPAKIVIREKPKLVFRNRKPSGISVFFSTLARKIKERPKIKREVIVKYKEIKVKPELPKPKEIPRPKAVVEVERKPFLPGILGKSEEPVKVKAKQEKLTLPKPEETKPSALKSFFSGFKSKHDVEVKEDIKTVSPLGIFKHKLELAEEPVKKKSEELEFPHLKSPVLTRRQVLEEGEKLAKVSGKYQHNLKYRAPVVEKVKKSYVSKGERELAKQQELLKKKLDSLY
ncbi:MAG: hypothetical protein V1645_00455 [archaeon]